MFHIPYLKCGGNAAPLLDTSISNTVLRTAALWDMPACRAPELTLCYPFSLTCRVNLTTHTSGTGYPTMVRQTTSISNLPAAVAHDFAT